MALHTALDNTDLTRLAGPHAVRWWLDATASTVVATAQVNQTTFGFPLAVLTVDNTSAGWASVSQGHTILIGTTPGGYDVGIYRCRLPGNSTTLYIGETADGDPGLITTAIRSTTIANNNYITVLDRYDIWSVAPRIVLPDGTIYEDFDQTVSSENFTPGPIINVSITTADGSVRYGHCATWVDANQTYATITFTVDPVLWPTSTTVSLYSWVIPGSWTVTSGSTSSATFTARVPAATDNYVVQCTVTDNNSIPRSGYRNVCVRDTTHQPLSIAEVGDITLDRTGAKATVMLNAAGLASIPQTGAMVHLWNNCTFNGANIASAWRGLTGWVIRQEETTEPGLRSVTLEIVGPAGILQLLGAYSQYIEVTNGIPSTWQQMVSGLVNADYLAFWLAAVRAKSLLKLFNWTVTNVTNTSQDLPLWKIDATSNLLTQMQTLLATIRANFGCNPDGEFMARLNPNLIDYDLPRSAFVYTRCTLTSARWARVVAQRENRPRVRRVRGEAFYWDGASTLPTPLLSDAPGASPGQGLTDDRLQSQIVDSQSQLNQVTGDYHAEQNNPYPSISIELPKAWGLVLYPAELSFAGLQVEAALRPTNVGLDILTIPTSISLRRNSDGTLDTALTTEGETHGVDGITVPIPPQSTQESTYNQLPATPPALTTGWGSPNSFIPSQLFMLGTAGDAYRLTSANSSAASAVDISPSVADRATLGNGLDAIADPWSYGDALCIFDGGIARLNNFMTCDPFPAAPWNIVYNLRTSPSYGYTMTDQIRGSINRSGYYCWLEHVETIPSADRWMELAYTTDNFATVNYTYLGFDNYGYRRRTSLWPGCFNTNSYGLIVVFNPDLRPGSEPRDQAILISTDWGATFTRMVPTGWDMGNWSPETYDGIAATAYSGLGGGEDRNNQAIWFTWYGQSGIIDTAGNVSLYQSGGAGAVPMNTDRCYNAYTLDARTKYAGWDSWLYKSTDGYTFSQLYDFGYPRSVNGMNGWPTNPNWLIVWLSDSTARITFNGGVSMDVTINLPANAQAIMANLEEVYTTAIHP